jgi:putative aminopeptidase FrvX
MMTPTAQDSHLKWLLELTGLPTAAGREDRVVAWLRAWARRRRKVVLREDRFGNLEMRRRSRSKTKAAPLYFTAHMDHPAFVARRAADKRTVVAEFRGGVAEQYFAGAKVLLHHGRKPPQRGTVRCRSQDEASPAGSTWDVVFSKSVKASEGDILTWDLAPPAIRGGRLHAPVCDDLAGVAAALGAFDLALSDPRTQRSDVRLLFTRSEEVGFIGMIAAVKARTIPRSARLITLENSRSFADSPIGGGPIVRVGDATSTFDPDLTYRIGRIAADLAADGDSFQWQRRLMAGGTCEASALQAYGHVATCLCLPLGNYHNMIDRTRRIGPEIISVGDFRDLVRLLHETACRLDSQDQAPALHARLDALFANRRAVLG